jgi:tetratricopeptide (TPR) repeat protein
MYTGRAEDAVRHAETAVALATDPRYDGFDPTWSRLFEGGGHLYAGRLDRWLEISVELAAESGFAHVGGLCGMLHALPSMQRGDEARALADRAVAAARAHGNPYAIAWALFASGRAFAQTEPGRALTTMRQALDYAREHGLSYWEARIARDAAGLEAAHGDPDQALALFDTAIDSLHRAGDDGTLATAIAYRAIFFGHAGHPEVAAILYGATTGSTSTRSVLDLPALVERLRATLGSDEFDERVGRGAAMDAATATQYARRQIERAGDRLRPIRQRRPAPAPIAAPPGQRPMPPAAVDVTRGDQ